ncbi:hypothetical protein STEG23_009285, partial [Scotinomys teguina]
MIATRKRLFRSLYLGQLENPLIDLSPCGKYWYFILPYFDDTLGNINNLSRETFDVKAAELNQYVYFKDILISKSMSKGLRRHGIHGTDIRSQSK